MKKLLSLFILLISLLFIIGLTHSVSARSINLETGSTVTVSEDSEGALAVTGQDIVVEGNVDGALFAAGNTITIKGDVNGDLFAAGNSITVEGSVEGEVYIAGNVIRTIAETEFARDAFIAGSELLINGSIGRDLFSGSNTIEINNAVGRNVNLSTNTIRFSENGAVGGNMFYQANSEVPNINQYVEGQVRYEEANTMQVRQERPQQTILRRILSIIGTVLSGAIIWWLLRKITQNWWVSISQRNLNRPIILILIGLGLLLLIPIIIILAFITRVLAGVGFFLLLLFILLLFLARIITASVIGKYVFENRFSLNKYNALVSFLVAFLILELARLIPIIGGFVTLIAILYAFGLIPSESLSRMRKLPL